MRCLQSSRGVLNSRKRSSRLGAAMVELAVCLPIFLAILLGIIEFGRAMSVAQLLNAAAREGCRDAIIEGSTTDSVRDLVRQQVVNTVGCSSQNVTVDISISSGESAGASAQTDLTKAESRDLITVKISVPHSAISFSLSRWLNGKTLRGVCAMRRE